MRINHAGDVWTVLNEGAVRDDGKVLCLLASTTRTHNHPSGPQPLKTAGWLDPDVLL